MDVTFSMVFFIISLTVGLFFVGGIIYLIVSLIKKKDENSKFKITSSLLLNIYLYGISFITLLLAVIGGALAIRSGLSSLVGIQFGYNLETANHPSNPGIYGEKDIYEIPECYIGEKIDVDGTFYCFDSKQQNRDLVNGVTLFVSMLLIFALHQYGIRGLKNKYEGIEKTYRFLSLVVYGLLGVVVIPMAIYQSMNYLLFKENPTNLEAPAMAIGLALLTLPLWITFLSKNLKEKDIE